MLTVCVCRKFGKLNILVNNAGYTWDGVIHKTTDQQWEAMFKVHCTGACDPYHMYGLSLTSRSSLPPHPRRHPLPPRRLQEGDGRGPPAREPCHHQRASACVGVALSAYTALPPLPLTVVCAQISSTSGIHGNAGQINYSTAKMGVLGMTKTVAKEWGPFGVRCNCIAFGCASPRSRPARCARHGSLICLTGSSLLSFTDPRRSPLLH